MSIQISIVKQLFEAIPHREPQLYFKSSLTALSHAMEDQILATTESPLVIASFQQERYYRQEASRYRRIAGKSDQVYVLAAPETEFRNSFELYEKIAFGPDDALTEEWHLVVISRSFASCLLCREKQNNSVIGDHFADNARRFEGIWTEDRNITEIAAKLLLDRITSYRPELTDKVKKAKQVYLINQSDTTFAVTTGDPFVQRLINYLQAGQYKVLKANRSLANKEKKERLVNTITTAIRRSLNAEDILQFAVEKLGESLGICRCIIYRCKSSDMTARINYEYLKAGLPSIQNKQWPLRKNDLCQMAIAQGEPISINNITKDLPKLTPTIKALASNYSIKSWLVVPILYQDRLIGILELHHCGDEAISWRQNDIDLVEAIALQVGIALIQAEAYSNLQDLNEQLAALDRTRSNLVAITGHELRTPLSTIQVCLESLASEPDMPEELRQVMLDTALQDAERLQTLVQDFLTLSKLESGRVDWNIEPLMLCECVELAMSHMRAKRHQNGADNLPNLTNTVGVDLPLVQADGEWLVEVIAKLLDNACKFTEAESGEVTIAISQTDRKNLTVSICDNGRGIEPGRLETIFDRFYQEEGALRRSAGGTGLGLAICRQIVTAWGGHIWAESKGKDQGSQFSFTVPISEESL